MESPAFTQRLLDRDEAAYEELIGEYARLLWTIAGRYLPKSAGFSAEDVEECVSDAFFQLWEHPERFDPLKGSLKTYLCTVAKHRAISMFRKRTAAATALLDDEFEQIAAPPEEAADYQALYDALARLPEPSREVLMRRYLYEQKPAAIAAAMSLPKKEVENRLYRAKKTLSVFLADDQEDRR